MQFGLAAAVNSSPRRSGRNVGKRALPTQATVACPRIGAHCVDRAQSLHPAGGCIAHARGVMMRAEIQNIVDEIKQSVGLLRRHL